MPFILFEIFKKKKTKLALTSKEKKKIKFQISNFKFQISNFKFQISNFEFLISKFKNSKKKKILWDLLFYFIELRLSQAIEPLS